MWDHELATKNSANDAWKREHEADAADRIKIKSGGQKIRVMEPNVSHRQRITFCHVLGASSTAPRCCMPPKHLDWEAKQNRAFVTYETVDCHDGRI